MQKFVAQDSFWELFPDARIGVFVVRGMKPACQVSAEDAAEIAQRLALANKAANKYLTSDTISENEVVAKWRAAFQKFRTKKGARCTIENLLKRVLKGNPVGSISPSVDICNTVALTFALPVGGEDIDRVVGDFRLGVTQGGDAFSPIGEEGEEPTLPCELCYFDDEGAICRCWNWRDGQRTALTDESVSAIMVIECIEPERTADLRAALDDYEALMVRYFGATVCAKAIIDRKHPELVVAE